MVSKGVSADTTEALLNLLLRFPAKEIIFALQSSLQKNLFVKEMFILCRYFWKHQNVSLVKGIIDWDTSYALNLL